MTPEITITDWIATFAAVAACVATSILAIIALKQASISDRQTAILRDHADIFRRQAGYQGQQTTISKRQADIAEKQAEIAMHQFNISEKLEHERLDEKYRANLTARKDIRANGDRYLIIKNEGPACAWNATIDINIDSLSESKTLRTNIFCIGVGSTIEQGPLYKSDMGDSAEIEIAWYDDSCGYYPRRMRSKLSDSPEVWEYDVNGRFCHIPKEEVFSSKFAPQK